MTTDLWMLVWTALLAALMPNVYLVGRLQVTGGLDWAFGNRDRPLAGTPPWVGRAERAHANLVENLAPFAILVLVAHVAGRADSITALGATIFFLARIAHAVVYIAGIAYLRTVVFFVAAIAEVMILVRLFA